MNNEQIQKLAEDYASKDFENKSSFEFHNQYTSFIEGYKAAMLQNKDEWVSVKDRLPDIRVPVLVYMKYGKIDTCYRDGESWIQSVRCQHSNGSVTHWQSLPELPEQTVIKVEETSQFKQPDISEDVESEFELLLKVKNELLEADKLPFAKRVEANKDILNFVSIKRKVEPIPTVDEDECAACGRKINHCVCP